MYKCICGKEFLSSQSFNAHQRGCALRHKEKGDYEEWLVFNKKVGQKSGETLRRKSQIKKREENERWVTSQPRCEKCGKVMTQKFGAGRFCSRSCANSHPGRTKPSQAKKTKKTRPQKTPEQKENELQNKVQKIQKFLCSVSFEGEEWKEFQASAKSDRNYMVWHISNFGRVARNFQISWGKKHKDGYSYLGNMRAVHRIVAEFFVPKTQEDIELNRNRIDHIDGNRSNNHYNNLRWCTDRENNNFPLARFRRSEALKGEKNHNYKKPPKNKGQILYNNGIITKYFPSGEEPPEGWIKGKIKSKLDITEI